MGHADRPSRWSDNTELLTHPHVKSLTLGLLIQQVGEQEHSCQ